MTIYDMSNNKSIVIVSEHFWPSTGATAQLVTDIAMGLSSKGCKVSIITSTQGPSISNLNIIRLYNSRGIGISLYAKLIRGLDFFSRSFWFLLNRVTPEDSKVLIVSNPPFIGLVGYLLNRIKGLRYVFLLQDVFPRSALLAGMLSSSNPVYLLFQYFGKLVASRSDAFVVLSNSMARRCMKDFGLNKPPRIIHNWSIVDPGNISREDNPLATEWGIRNQFIVQYSGNFGRLHDILTILEAARILLKHDEIKFVFIGSGSKAKMIKTYKHRFNLDNIIIENYQPRKRLPFSLSLADVSLISLMSGSEDTVAPSKFYGIIAGSRPYIFIGSKSSEYSEISSHFKCGCSIEPGDVQGLCQSILQLHLDRRRCLQMGTSASLAYNQLYSKELSIEQYYELLAH